MTPRIAMLTYSSKPRGGVVHALHLAEALHAQGADVHLFALGNPREGFYRPAAVPHTLFPAPGSEGTLEERVFAAVDALATGLAREAGGFDLLHAQDCIAARAVLDLRDRAPLGPLIRTVHHIDDFTTPALVECQHRSVVEPDRVLVVSEFWRRALAEEHGIEASVVPNGVDVARFAARPDPDEARELRARAGAERRFLFLTVGGIEPRKGTMELIEALAALRKKDPPGPVVAVVGGHSFQDHTPYRERVLARMEELRLELGRDLVLLGTVPDDELVSWYRAADAFVFPSAKEGFGLVVLEALASSLPVVATDIPVFGEYLTHGADALLARAGDAASLAAEMRRVMREPDLRGRLADAGPSLAARYSWEASASRHREVYAEVLRAAEPVQAG
ncbi:MAG TPA: MSMEG_0565 family glycosyltransferase [Actinomycetota bacterium]|nr:MSMEG_0565 family glycosyltransferase [Actinomycetota bacterium]